MIHFKLFNRISDRILHYLLLMNLLIAIICGEVSLYLLCYKIVSGVTGTFFLGIRSTFFLCYKNKTNPTILFDISVLKIK